MLRNNKNDNRENDFHRDDGKSRFPGSEWGKRSEWGENSEFGKNSDFHKKYRESDSYDRRRERPFDMDDYYSGRQFSVGGVDFDAELDDDEWKSSRYESSREYNRSRFAEPYRKGRYESERSNSDQDWGSGYRPESESSFKGVGPKGYKRSDDRIREEVCEALYRSPFVDASDIEATVKEGCVYLRGTVDNRNAKREAETCVENLKGVEDVLNEIRIKGSAESNLSESSDKFQLENNDSKEDRRDH